MPLSCILALVVGLAGGQSSRLLVPLILVYAASMNLDSAALTAGLLTETSPEKRGTALALYSSIGFAGGLIGPVAFGVVLDCVGRNSHAGWTAGFVTLACGVGVGRCAIGTIAAAPACFQR
jgi:MFS family permease